MNLYNIKDKQSCPRFVFISDMIAKCRSIPPINQSAVGFFYPPFFVKAVDKFDIAQTLYNMCRFIIFIASLNLSLNTR